jgi:hypothetical protein
MDISTDKWLGFHHFDTPVTGDPGLVLVTIYPAMMQAPVLPSGERSHVPTPATIYVRRGNPPTPERYSPPERPFPGLDRADYEQRALEIVSARAD